MAAGRAAAVLVLLPAAVRHPRRLRLPPVRAVQALLVGAGAALGLILRLGRRQVVGLVGAGGATVLLSLG
ncbi:hypothetical protein [Streptomyces sp. NPDC058307]|uniref:hypothetical protein n=1 Tax=Streptomyces sp. NPDC058307 TaxID=3346439 RepID=UPI0036E07854